jgi:RNA polymerase sigma factor (sigma-70 family)
LAKPESQYVQLQSQDLIAAALREQTGEVWAELVHRFLPLLTRTVSRIARQFGEASPAVVDDLVQEIFLKLCQNDFQQLRACLNVAAHPDALAHRLSMFAAGVARDSFKMRARPQTAPEENTTAGEVPLPKAANRYGQHFRLARAALRLRTFTVAELESLTGAATNTVYAFLHNLSNDEAPRMESQDIASARRGRPRKKYTLTQAGYSHLLEQNSRLVSILEDKDLAGSEEAEADPDLSVRPGEPWLTQPFAAAAGTSTGAEEELRQRVYEVYERHDAPFSSQELERNVLLQEIDRELRELLPDRFGVRDRTIFWLHYRDGLRASEIASIPGIRLSPRGVEKVLLRVSHLMRAKLLQKRTVSVLANLSSETGGSRR